MERANDGDVNQEIDRVEPEGVEPGEAEEDVCAVVDREGKHGEGAVAAMGVIVSHRCPPEIVFEHTIQGPHNGRVETAGIVGAGAAVRAAAVVVVVAVAMAMSAGNGNACNAWNGSGGRGGATWVVV